MVIGISYGTAKRGQCQHAPLVKHIPGSILTFTNHFPTMGNIRLASRRKGPIAMTMQQLPSELVANFERRLDRAQVPPSKRPEYHKWVRFYLYFCQKYDFPPTAPTALGPFLTKLVAKEYSIDQRHHAATAIRLLMRPDPQDPSLYLQLSTQNLAGPETATMSPVPSSTSATT